MKNYTLFIIAIITFVAIIGWGREDEPETITTSQVIINQVLEETNVDITQNVTTPDRFMPNGDPIWELSDIAYAQSSDENYYIVNQ